MRSLVLAGLAVLLITAVTGADEPKAPSVATVDSSKSDDQSTRHAAPLANQYHQILAEFEAGQAAFRQAVSSVGRPREKPEVAQKKRSPDLVEYCRRMLDLAESSPSDPAARDALLWVINKPGAADFKEYGDQFARAVALLVRHHGDDPEAVRIGLRLDNWVTPRRDALLLGFYASAKGREARGLARLALAQYLAHKAKEVVYARGVEGRPKMRIMGGGKVVREVDLIDEQ